MISGIGYSIVYAQETYSETGSDEGLQDTDSGSVMTEELQNPSGEQDYGRGSYSQYGEQYTSNTNQAGQTGITDTFSSESDQGDETPVIDPSSSYVLTNALRAPAETKTTAGTGNASPKTGDINNVLLFVMMFAISACVLVGMAVKRKKG